MKAGENIRVVHFVYLIPSDRQQLACAALRQTALHLQQWYRWQMGNGKTFTLHDPIVEAVHTAHPAAWYSTNDPGGAWAGWFWINTLNELATWLGGGFYQPNDSWVVYIESGPANGQYAGGTSGGYISGVCVLGDKDSASIRGVDPDWTLCRGIGGCGHEMGHTFGLPHPEGEPEWGIALMGTGYGIYSQCILTQSAKDYLNTNPFFAEEPIGRVPPVCPF
jgi:hypothetical protein